MAMDVDDDDDLFNFDAGKIEGEDDPEDESDLFKEDDADKEASGDEQQ